VLVSVIRRDPDDRLSDRAGWCVVNDLSAVLPVKRHRDLGRLKSKAACRLHALLMELEPGGMAKEMTVTRASEILDRIEPATQTKASMKRLRTAVAASGTSLAVRVGRALRELQRHRTDRGVLG
jgi:hypothetical protein